MSMYNELSALVKLEEALGLPDADLRQVVEQITREWEDSLIRQANEMEALDRGTY